jgi:hypothetical protein
MAKRRAGLRIVPPPGRRDLRVLLFGVVRAGLRCRANLVAENLLLCHPWAVLARPTRQRPPL